MMTDTKPVSFKIFVAVISITVLVLIAAGLFAHYQADKKYALVLAFFQFMALACTTVGIYTGFNYNSSEENLQRVLNRVGLAGNMVIFVFTAALLAFAVVVAT